MQKYSRFMYSILRSLRTQWQCVHLIANHCHLVATAAPTAASSPCHAICAAMPFCSACFGCAVSSVWPTGLHSGGVWCCAPLRFLSLLVQSAFDCSKQKNTPTRKVCFFDSRIKLDALADQASEKRIARNRSVSALRCLNFSTTTMAKESSPLWIHDALGTDIACLCRN